MGSAFHARCADPDSAEARERWNRLSKEEQSEAASWIRPTDLVLENGVVLSYDQAYKELPLGLAANGSYQAKGAPGNVTEGTCDICWVVEQDGMRIAYVPDIKRSEYTVADGPESLQILGYAIAAAQYFGCDGYVAGIWAAKEGTWWWGNLFLYGRDDDAINEHWQRVKAAALNVSEEPSFGAHCQGCYGRRFCPSWLMPPELAETSLAPFAVEGMAITSEQAVSLLVKLKQLETVEKAVKDLLKAHVRDGNRVIDEATGKEWRPITVAGRVSLDAEKFEREQPELFKAYTKNGAPSEQFRWVNAEPKKKARSK